MKLIGITCFSDQSGRYPGYAIQSQGLAYTRAVTLAGGTPLLIPLHQNEDALAAALAGVDGLILPGGVDVDPWTYGEAPHRKLGRVDPEEDRVELYLARQAIESGKPTLAICRGFFISTY